jgi:hypothetical protein
LDGTVTEDLASDEICNLSGGKRHTRWQVQAGF